MSSIARNIHALWAHIHAALNAFGLSRRAARRRRATTDLRLASEYLKADIGYYEGLRGQSIAASIGAGHEPAPDFALSLAECR